MEKCFSRRALHFPTNRVVRHGTCSNAISTGVAMPALAWVAYGCRVRWTMKGETRR